MYVTGVDGEPSFIVRGFETPIEMPRLRTNDVETYYESRGSGPPVVFVHGAWVDRRQWTPQVEALADDYRVVTYDVRGHGRTGPSAEERYSVELFAADLRALIEALGLDRPVVCGLSLGGMIAQAYAARYDELRGLVLADTAVSTRLTWKDTLTSLLAPKWAMTSTVRLLGPRRYVDVAFWLARVTRDADWFGRDPAVAAYVRETMSAFDAREFNKVFGATYDFRRVDLGAITAPTLVLDGEFESDSVFEHTAHLQRSLADVRTGVIPEAGHTSNMENPEAFTAELQAFLDETTDDT